MKTLRLITMMIVAVLVLSAWTPAPVSAKGAASELTIAPNGASASLDNISTKVVKLTIHNRTGGVLFVTLAGTKNYYFTIGGTYSKFNIDPGRYTVTAITTACGGVHVKMRNMKQGGNLAYVCDDYIGSN